MAKNLVIVESPAKAKTIEKYLGGDYIVKASFGHIRDLSKEDNAIDVKNGYRPRYEVPNEKKKVVSELRKLTESAEMVWLATDEDREGEAIAWHLYEELQLDRKNVKRVVYHEITKPAIMAAFASPRDIDYNLVDAQQARRTLDRLVGFELSPILWKKVKPSLSAGRVQSVAVRLIVEREREIAGFESSSAYKVTASLFSIPTEKSFKAELSERFAVQSDAGTFLRQCTGAEYTVKNLEIKPSKKSPSPPFTTSTLQQEASRKLGFSITKTMKLAQDLYEAGHITYMRTDSVNLSDIALGMAHEEILKSWGENYANTRRYSTKAAGAQEAHEAIRPTAFDRRTIDAHDRDARRLYELIWQRATASQMADAQIERTIITVNVSTVKQDLVKKYLLEQDLVKQDLIAKGEVLKFEGFLKVYGESADDDAEEDDTNLLPIVSIGEKLGFNYMTATEKFAKPPARYNEASLVKKLEDLGIGRPSTYAPTIQTIQTRNYIVKEDREAKQRDYSILTLLPDGKVEKEVKTESYGAEKQKLFPTDVGGIVTDFLIRYFSQIMDYNFTATVEKQFDEIAEGQKQWVAMLDEFYGPFHKTVENTMGEAKRNDRLLGTEPGTERKVIAKYGRFGPMIQIGEAGEADVKFSSLPPHTSLESITLEEAIALFRLPRIVGMFEGAEMKVAIGKYGPYIQHSGQFCSIEPPDDPLTITEARAIELIIQKREAVKSAVIREFEGDATMRILRGKYGPYIKAGELNARIPRGVNPETLTLEDCRKLVGEQFPAKADAKKASAESGGAKTKAGAKKTNAKSGGTKTKAGAKKNSKKTTE
ncbi:type I DNA topoisomerase [Ignavibacteria bacterium]|nr:type I DNA topoisomerase [Bacteroidota bacterium]